MWSQVEMGWRSGECPVFLESQELRHRSTLGLHLGSELALVLLLLQLWLLSLNGRNQDTFHVHHLTGVVSTTLAPEKQVHHHEQDVCNSNVHEEHTQIMLTS